MYNKIMVPLDGSPLAECVFPHLEAFARGCGTKSVIFIRAVDHIGLHPAWEYTPTKQERESAEKKIKADAENYLKQIVSRIKYDGVEVKSEVITGRAADVLADYAARNGVDLIIMATHGRSGISRLAMGSVAQRVSQSACVPVLLVRSPECKV